MTNYSLYSDDQLRELLRESVVIMDQLFESLANRNRMLVEQQKTIDELAEKVERYNGILFAEPEKAEGGTR